MTCREDVLKAAIKIVKMKKSNEFEPKEIVNFLLKTGSKYQIFTIRDEIQRFCVNCPKKFTVKKYNYFERIEKGRYRLLPEYL